MTQRKAPSKAAPRKAAPKTATSVARKVADMRHEIDTLAWLHAELVHSWRVYAAHQMLQQPQFQQALVDKIIQAQQGGMQ